MIFSQRIITASIVFIIFYLTFPQEAKAYLDPGTGSYVFQLFLASLLGALFALKLFWHKIKSFFRTIFVKRTSHEKDEEEL